MHKMKSFVMCSSLSESQIRPNLTLVMIMTANKVVNFFHWSLRHYVKHNGECEICHHNWHYRVKPDNKYDGSYRAHDSPAKQLHMIIFILILAEEKFKHWTK